MFSPPNLCNISSRYIVTFVSARADFSILSEQGPARVLSFAKFLLILWSRRVLCPRCNILDESVFAFILEKKSGKFHN